MKNTVSFPEIVARLVYVMNKPEELADYEYNGDTYDGIAGWCGVMSPVSRPAFVRRFGADVVERAEQQAREELQARADRHNATQYHAHTIEADRLAGVPAVGGFFWGINSGLKCDGGRGVCGEIADLINRTEYNDDEQDAREFAARPARLCQVREVFHVSPAEFDRPSLADELTEKHQPEGGSASDDIPDGATWYDLTDEQRATLYTFGALVTDGRRYYLIDTEGYSYARYIYVPQNWREDLADIVAAERYNIEERARQMEQEEADAQAARRAEYDAKCAKWAHLMEDVRPLEEKERAAWAHRSDKEARRAHTAAKRATDCARKRNILAMCRAAFPGVSFSVSVRRGWGADFVVTWTDGPTLEEFNEQTDLDLFRSSWDTFDGMTDCAGHAYAEFTDFSALTMGSNAGDVETCREWSEATRAELVAAVMESAPALGKYEAESTARREWNATSYYHAPAPTEPTTAPTLQDAPEITATATEGAPAPDGLQLIETADGVAVVGDARTTYRHRREIKAHGARWNKTAQQWQATTPEAVESLRQWFGVTDDCELWDADKIRAAVEGTNEQAAEAVAHIEAVAEAVASETTAEAAPRYGVPEKSEPAQALRPEEVEGLRQDFAEAGRKADEATDRNDHTEAVIITGSALFCRFSSSLFPRVRALLDELRKIKARHLKRRHILPAEVERREHIADALARLTLDEYGADLAATLWGSHKIERITNERATA